MTAAVAAGDADRARQAADMLLATQKQRCTQKRQWVEPVEYDATVQQYRPVKVDHATLQRAGSAFAETVKREMDDAPAYPTSLEQWIPISAPTIVGSFREPGRPLRISATRVADTGVGTITIHASPDLKPGEIAFAGVDRTAPVQPLVSPKPVDPLDVEYDGLRLRELLVADEVQRRGECTPHVRFTPAQRAAVSAHWSAELRAKVAAAKERERNRERNRVTMECDE